MIRHPPRVSYRGVYVVYLATLAVFGYSNSIMTSTSTSQRPLIEQAISSHTNAHTHTRTHTRKADSRRCKTKMPFQPSESRIPYGNLVPRKTSKATGRKQVFHMPLLSPPTKEKIEGFNQPPVQPCSSHRSIPLFPSHQGEEVYRPLIRLEHPCPFSQARRDVYPYPPQRKLPQDHCRCPLILFYFCPMWRPPPARHTHVDLNTSGFREKE